MLRPRPRTSFTRTLNDSRNARFKVVLALDDAFIDFRPACHVIRLHRQHFLQRVSRAVSFQSPDFHLTETLSTELRLTTQRLLGDK